MPVRRYLPAVWYPIDGKKVHVIRKEGRRMLSYPFPQNLGILLVANQVLELGCGSGATVVAVWVP